MQKAVSLEAAFLRLQVVDDGVFSKSLLQKRAKNGPDSACG